VSEFGGNFQRLQMGGLGSTRGCGCSEDIRIGA
jgi:hypothetical protein